MSNPARSVFVNCPFDDDYKSCFEAIVFTVMASGFQVRCALEENDASAIRFDKLCGLIETCDRSVHDLSRTEVGEHGLPRFNMPFDLGLFMGAKRFGGTRQRRKTALIMIGEPYRLPVYLSDLAGNDPEAHHGGSDEVIGIVRRYLHAHPDGTPLAGANRMLAEHKRFKAELPALAAALHIEPEELDPYREYRTYVWLLAEFLRAT